MFTYLVALEASNFMEFLKKLTSLRSSFDRIMTTFRCFSHDCYLRALFVKYSKIATGLPFPKFKLGPKTIETLILYKRRKAAQRNFLYNSVDIIIFPKSIMLLSIERHRQIQRGRSLTKKPKSLCNNLCLESRICYQMFQVTVSLCELGTISGCFSRQ